MGFILVPPDQQRVDVKIADYPGESDKGPIPVPDNMPIEGWPADFSAEPGGQDPTLDDVQRDVLKQGGDRHAIVVDPVNRMLYEFYQMKKTDRGWQAAQASIFDLKTNKLRPDGWTSTDAAGLPIFPGHGPLRRDAAGHGRARHAGDGGQDPPGLRGPGHAFCQPADQTRTCRGWASGSGCSRTSTSPASRPRSRRSSRA